MAPGSEQIWIRSFIVFLMIVFSGIVQAIINKRKSIEAALLVSEERYRRLEAVSAEGILIHDNFTRFTRYACTHCYCMGF